MTRAESGSGYRFEIVDSKDQVFVRFRAANGEVMLRSETYSAKTSAKNCIDSVKKNAPDAPVEDETASA
ncbi:YegP family protein [Xaviernesmea oryzae]|uniref:YegP family protein n=1 Tax=Xaviernesmea oryzae TaxID=464029 RepID=UPI00389AA922